MSIQDGLLILAFPSFLGLYWMWYVCFDLVLWVVNHLSGLGDMLTGSLTNRSSAPGSGQCPEPLSTLEHLSKQDDHTDHATY